jgi:hypothetical protein
VASPTQLSLKLFRESGYHAAVTEHWNSFIHIRQDLFGFCDIEAFKPSGSVILCQTTTRTNQRARVAKILSNPIARAWLQSDNREIVVHGWAKVGAKGKRKTWQVTVTCLSLDMFTAESELLSPEDALCPKSENCLSSGGI